MSVCRACGSEDAVVLHETVGVPVHNSRLLTTARSAAAVPTGDLRLAACRRCGFVQNDAFDASLVRYDDDYEDTQAHSPRFLEFVADLVDHLDRDHRMAGSRILEVGCGKGDVLALVADGLGGRGVGYDPALGPGALPPSPSVRLVPELFDESAQEDADLVMCRHTLEHVQDVAGFVAMVRRATGGSSPLTYVEVPDTGRVLRERAYWDVYYEHCSYFTAPSLAALFARNGYRVLDVRTGYDDQYLMLDARPTGDGGDAVDADELAAHAESVVGAVRSYDAGVRELRDTWRERMVKWRDAGRSVALWGAGSKAVGFMTGVDAGPAVEVAVDINPRKHGRFLPGCALEVVGPEQLADRGIDVVVVMNPVYLNEISDTLAGLGIRPEVVAA